MRISDKSVIIGVDVGGTKIKTGAVQPDGNINCDPVTIDTGANDDAEKVFERISSSIETTIKNSGHETIEIIGIGMGVTGPLDPENGLILECPQLPTMHFYPLREKILEKFSLPVVMDNDANALLLGESIWGAGKGYRSTLGFTLGTGLGSAIVVDNKLFTGANGMAGEIWPSPNKNGNIEDIVSGNGVSVTYLRLANQWGVNMIDPDIGILGGSIANSIDLFHKSMDTYLRKHICPVPSEKTRIVKAELGDNAGFMGSAALMIQGKNEV